MGQTTDQIVNEIDKTREELLFNLEELEARAKELADWRHHFEKHPGKLLAGALIGGMLLASVFKKRVPF